MSEQLKKDGDIREVVRERYARRVPNDLGLVF